MQKNTQEIYENGLSAALGDASSSEHMVMNNELNEQFLYLTTIGRKTGLPREIEIWFVELNGRLYVLAEHGYKAQWVQNVIVDPSVTIRLAGRSWSATGRVLEPETDELYLRVRELARVKYGWGDGLPVEFRLTHEIQ
jgi:deazaflavin-dependent oxidoreductase (nitroreductase family)